MASSGYWEAEEHRLVAVLTTIHFLQSLAGCIGYE